MHRQSFASGWIAGVLTMGLVTRLLMAGGGSGAFTPPGLGDLTEALELTSAPNGGWAEPQRSKAVRYGDHVYVGWADGTSGNIEVSSIDLATMTAGAPINLHSALGGIEGGPADMHDNPALLVRSTDHRLWVVYSGHAASEIYIRISVDSLDDDPTLANGFDSELGLDAQLAVDHYDYPVLLEMSAETGSPVYLFFRSTVIGTSPHNTTRLLYSQSTDGATWAANEYAYINPGYSAYWQVNGNGVDRIDVLAQNKNENEVTLNELRHFYFTGGSFYQTDGTLIAAAPLVTALAPGDATLVANSGGYHLYSQERDATTGHIAGTATAAVSGVGYVRRFLWDGSTWTETEIMAGETTSWGWGSGVDPTDFDRALVAQTVAGQQELWQYHYDGATWSGASLTASLGLTDDMLFPIWVRDADARLRAVALYGTYAGYLTSEYSLGVWAVR